MTISKYKQYTAEDFILDEVFIRGVLHPESEEAIFWARYAEKNPDKREDIEHARMIIKAMKVKEEDIPQHRLDQIFQNIRPRNNRKIILKRLSYAAAVLFIVAISGLAYYLNSSYRQNFSLETASTEMLVKGKIILSDGSTKEFDSDLTTIHQTASGKLTINNDTIVQKTTDQKETEKAMNQIIIPYGKHSEVILSDGTHIWLNSGSQLSYPSEFKKDSREVFLSGEAFFDVTHDAGKPFYVITQEVKVKVLGTKFNVSSYLNDATTQTVLIQGKVTVGKNKLFSSTIELMPGERMTYTRHTEQLNKDKVDPQLYSSWINGYLIFENEPTPEVLKKLERYYNQTIIAEEGLNKISFSGKLDLKEDLQQVLENLSFAANVTVTKNENKYIVKP